MAAEQDVRVPEMRIVDLGRSGLKSSALGLGCMGMSEFYGQGDEAESQRTLARAVELGITMLDTSDLYGRGENELLIGRFLKGRPRDSVLIATKFGILRDPEGPEGSTHDRDLDNSPEHMRRSCEASLKRLGTDVIDLYYVHRHDPRRPIEEVVGALADLVREGKIRAIGLSEVPADILRRAQAVHPIAALQSEYSLFTRDVEREVLPACRELEIAFLPYSPLGRGILTGRITSTAELSPNDLRLASPRFSGDSLARNLALLDRVRSVAAAHNATLGQIALAWLLNQGDDILPIPGTKRVKYLEENAGSVAIRLSPAELAQLDRAIAPEEVAGSRHWVPAAPVQGQG